MKAYESRMIVIFSCGSAVAGLAIGFAVGAMVGI
jgi:hypothetical protein